MTARDELARYVAAIFGGQTAYAEWRLRGFIDKVIAEERETCARIAYRHGADAVAEAIRSRTIT